MTCEDLQTTLFLVAGDVGGLDASARAHLSECDRCRAEEARIRAVAQALATEQKEPPDPAPDLGERILGAARSILATRAATPGLAATLGGQRTLLRALAAALALLPVILLLNAYALRAAYGVLSSVLPAALSAYLLFNYAALIALLITLTYAAVPVLAHRQLRHGSQRGFA